MKTVDHTDVLASVLGPALHSFRAVVPYELAALYDLHAGRLEARTATGPLASPVVRQHSIVVAQLPLLQQALDAGRPTLLAHELLYANLLEVPLDHSCLVVPLLCGEERMGLLSLLGRGSQVYASDAMLERAATYGQGLATALAVARQAEPPSPLGAPGRLLPLREAERRHLMTALEHTRGKIYGRDGAARLLDLKPTTLQSKLKKHGINRLDAVNSGTADEGPSLSTSDDHETGGHVASVGAANPPQSRSERPSSGASAAAPQPAE